MLLQKFFKFTLAFFWPFFGLPRPLLATGSPFSPSFSIFLSALAGALLAGLPRFLVSLESLSFTYNLQHI